MTKRLLQARNSIRANKNQISRKKLRGKDHIIVSGVTHMIADSTMNSIYYPKQEVETLAEQLVNRRIVMPAEHPTGDEGEFISASDPLALMSNFVGAFAFNFSMRGDRLISDAAIDPEVAKTSEYGKAILNAIENGEPMDMSTGFYLNVDEVNGCGKDGEPYDGIASSLQMDHSAFLPASPGAKNKCDGVGLHTNSAKDVNGNMLDTDVIEVVNTSTPAMKLPLAPVDTKWDASAADKRVREYTDSMEKPSSNYRKFFLSFDPQDVESFGAYKLPFADIIDGTPHVVKAAIDNAKARLDQTDIDDNDKEAAMKVIAMYQERFELELNAEPSTNAFKKAWNKFKSLFTNEASHSDIHEMLYKKLNENRDPDERSLYPIDIYEDYFVYVGENDTMYRQGYKISGKSVMFDGSPVEVERVTEYKTVSIDTGGPQMDKKDIIALLESKGISVNAEISDADLKAELDKAIAKPANNSDNGGQADDINQVVANAVAEAIKPLQEQITANENKEQKELAEQVAALDIGIDEEAAKAMSVNSLKSVLAKNTGHAVFNSAGSMHNNASGLGLKIDDLPEE